MTKDSYYFKHDSNARHDPKSMALINKCGLEGYGRFWVIIEIMRESSKYKIEDKPYVWQSLSQELKCTVQEVKDFFNDCVEFELFVKDEGFFYSESLLQRMAHLDLVRNKRKFAADVKHGNETRNHWDD